MEAQEQAQENSGYRLRAGSLRTEQEQEPAPVHEHAEQRAPHAEQREPPLVQRSRQGSGEASCSLAVVAAAAPSERAGKPTDLRLREEAQRCGAIPAFERVLRSELAASISVLTTGAAQGHGSHGK